MAAARERKRGKVVMTTERFAISRVSPFFGMRICLIRGTIMAKSDAIRRVGMFDERLFIYDEHTDLFIRLRKAGSRTVAVRDALAWP